MPLSRDPEKRAKQLANLRPGAGRWKPGAAPALEHGLRTRHPSPIVLDPVVREIETALAADLPLKDADGKVPGADRFAVELAAIALLRVRRCAAYLDLHGDVDDRGNLRPAFLKQGRAVEHAARMLDRIGCSPRARVALGLDLQRGLDLAQAMAADAEAERREGGGGGA